MKKRYPVFAIILTTMLSVGFRYDTGTPSISTPLNVYLHDTTLLVSDSLNGLLVYSVANAQAPKFKARVPLNGNRGAAMKDSIIYANSWGGILAIRLVNDTDYEVTSVIKDDPYHHMLPDCGTTGYYESGGFDCGPRAIAAGGTETLDVRSGTGGSYAIFAVIDSFLYYINSYSIITMDISNPASPKKLSETYIGWNIETLFPTRQYLFIGGSNGMFVMDRSNPTNPVQISSIAHFRARDPVVVHDSMAYVTLRAATNPGVGADELMVVNLGSISNPKLVREMLLSTPFGLTIKDSLMYVAQGYNGWTLFGLTDPLAPALAQHWTSPVAKDFIWSGDRLYMMCFDGVKIYSTADPLNPALLGEIR